jgi:hypothetical protein
MNGGIAPFAEGFNSHAYLVGGHVVKISKHPKPHRDAAAELGRAFDHYSLLCNHLGEFVVPTSFTLNTDPHDPSKSRLVTTQPFVEGTPLAKGANYDEDLLLALWRASLLMYYDTNKIADIAAVEGKFFDPLCTTNVIVNSAGEPILADVDTGRVQGSKLLGRPWSWFIANGVRRGIRRLESQEA